MPQQIVWEWLGRPGLEHLTLTLSAELILAEGFVVADLGPGAFALRYRLSCDAAWRVTEASVSLEERGGKRQVELRRKAGIWSVDGAHRSDLDGCDEIDIQGTPFTNTLPIRRLQLVPQAPHMLRVAYVIIPALTVEAGTQEYTRLDMAEPPRRFRYRNPANGFVAELTVDENGIVDEYEGIWRRRT